MKEMEKGAKKVIFTACYFGKLKLTFTSPNIISTSPKNVLMSRLISQFFCNLNSSKKFTCPSGKLITEFTSLIAKFTSPGLSDTTFFARCGECFFVSLSSYPSPLHVVPTIWRNGTRTKCPQFDFLSEEITKMRNECRKKHQSKLLESWDWNRLPYVGCLKDQRTKMDLNFKILAFV